MTDLTYNLRRVLRASQPAHERAAIARLLAPRVSGLPQEAHLEDYAIHLQAVEAAAAKPTESRLRATQLSILGRWRNAEQLA